MSGDVTLLLCIGCAITTTMTIEPVATSELSTNRTGTCDDISYCRYAIWWLLRWLWVDQDAATASKKTHGKPEGSVETSQKKPDILNHVSSEMKMVSDKLEYATATKDMPCCACLSRGAECDLRRPRCSHCLDEQIRCFYVPPRRLAMACSKAQESTCV
ncbi:hypothetical protein BDV10DRAFT_22671 [Aspergillus recurvatus]